jgi:integrase
LHQLNFRLPSPKSLKEKHIVALARHWAEDGLAARTLHTRFSMLRVFAGWIGKAGLVRDIERYFPDPEVIKRSTVATENRSWTAKDIEPLEVIERAKPIDEGVALNLMLQYAFRLRVKESIEMRPGWALHADGKWLEVFDGTKGGRPRLVAVDTEERREAIRWAQEFAARQGTSRIRARNRTWKQAQRRFYKVMEKLGITKKDLGVTAHGLRHGGAQDEYRGITGLPSPIEGGALGQIDRKTHQKACIHVSRMLGHGRSAVTTAYYGSYGHKLRTTKAPETPSDTKAPTDPEE